MKPAPNLKLLLRALSMLGFKSASKGIDKLVSMLPGLRWAKHEKLTPAGKSDQIHFLRPEKGVLVVPWRYGFSQYVARWTEHRGHTHQEAGFDESFAQSLRLKKRAGRFASRASRNKAILSSWPSTGVVLAMISCMRHFFVQEIGLVKPGCFPRDSGKLKHEFEQPSRRAHVRMLEARARETS